MASEAGEVRGVRTESLRFIEQRKSRLTIARWRTKEASKRNYRGGREEKIRDCRRPNREIGNTVHVE